jgi:hypothetical protein
MTRVGRVVSNGSKSCSADVALRLEYSDASSALQGAASTAPCSFTLRPPLVTILRPASPHSAAP